VPSVVWEASLFKPLDNRGPPILLVGYGLDINLSSEFREGLYADVPHSTIF
ncbi:UNVERIFIED_CONTAM: hypothetical protein Sindi_1662100, partial [Sesamum indicum]